MSNLNTEWTQDLENSKNSSGLAWIALQQLTLLEAIDLQIASAVVDTKDPANRKEFREIFKLKSDLLNKLWDELETLYPQEQKEQQLEVILREVSGESEV